MTRTKDKSFMEWSESLLNYVVVKGLISQTNYGSTYLSLTTGITFVFTIDYKFLTFLLWSKSLDLCKGVKVFVAVSLRFTQSLSLSNRLLIKKKISAINEVLKISSL